MAHILVIEDHELQSMIIQRALEKDDHQLTVVLDSTQIFPTIEATRPDLIITDLDMQNINGIDVINYVKTRAELQNIPVIVYTAIALRHIQEQAHAAGCDAYLMKPMNLPELREFVKHFLETYYTK
jgi:CheY-like chemotaxis protein